METFILVLFFHVGIFGDTDSNATTHVHGFASKEECVQAGKDAKKELEFVCLKQTK